MSEAERLNLTGGWSGVFSYLGVPEPDVSFVARLEEVAGLFTGSTVEPNTIGDTTTDLCAIVRGSRDGTDVTFRKAYDGASDAAHAVDYFGTLSSDGMRMTGFWKLDGDASTEGGFEMNRDAATREQEAELELEEVPAADFGALLAR